MRGWLMVVDDRRDGGIIVIMEREVRLMISYTWYMNLYILVGLIV